MFSHGGVVFEFWLGNVLTTLFFGLVLVGYPERVFAAQFPYLKHTTPEALDVITDKGVMLLGQAATYLILGSQLIGTNKEQHISETSFALGMMHLFYYCWKASIGRSDIDNLELSFCLLTIYASHYVYWKAVTKASWRTILQRLKSSENPSMAQLVANQRHVSRPTTTRTKPALAPRQQSVIRRRLVRPDD